MANSDKVENNEHCPWLMMTHGKKFQIQTFYNLLEDRYFINMIPEMRKKLVSQASYGWLLLIDKDVLDCCLLNPKTKEKFQLPQLEEYGPYKCTLSKPPTELECHVLLVGPSTLFCRIGDDNFKERPDIHSGHLGSAINYQGKIYAWMKPMRGLVTIDFQNEDIVLKNLVKKNGQLCQPHCIDLSPSNAPIYYDRLIESRGELLLVHMVCGSSIIWDVSRFRIFKIDIVDMEWKELYSIGDRAIFISEFGGMAMSCSSEETSVEKDSIYYFSVARPEQNLYVYNIRDRGHTRLLPSRRVRADSFKSWIML